MTPEPTPPLILIVDDYADGRGMILEYLQQAGYRAACAVDGADAIAKAVELLPDLILMDLDLPVMNGWEATRQLKLDARTAAIPVIALSGQSLADETESALGAGCDAMVSKPYRPEDVLREIRTRLEKVRLTVG